MTTPPIILIVEDEQLVADDLKETLESLGYQVPQPVATGEAAIQQALQIHPDLVLMDIRLAGAIDGIEAAEKILAQASLPIVYLTANADRPTLERVKGSNPYGYILKPFNEVILSTTIDIALSRHYAEVQVQAALSNAEMARQETESQMQIKTEYFSMASHEFRNPLATIQFATDYLHRYGEELPLDKRQTHLERIKLATDSLNSLLEDVLTLSRVGSSHYQFEPCPVDVMTSCQEITEALKFTFDDHYTIRFTATGDYLTALLDEKLLWHLLNNLLSNAIKYSPQGGTITLELSSTVDEICFIVKDDGIGIPPNAIDQLFKPFHRASNVGKIPGTGLGLAIVKQCVEVHKGQISVQSELGRGTQFIVTLPRGVHRQRLR